MGIRGDPGDPDANAEGVRGHPGGNADRVVAVWEDLGRKPGGVLGAPRGCRKGSSRVP